MEEDKIAKKNLPKKKEVNCIPKKQSKTWMAMRKRTHW